MGIVCIGCCLWSIVCSFMERYAVYRMGELCRVILRRVPYDDCGGRANGYDWIVVCVFRRVYMYRVIYDYGIDGWHFVDMEFFTGMDALKYAMAQGRSEPFEIVKMVKFAEVEE